VAASLFRELAGVEVEGGSADFSTALHPVRHPLENVAVASCKCELLDFGVAE
jgi:hypothetical protein